MSLGLGYDLCCCPPEVNALQLGTRSLVSIAKRLSFFEPGRLVLAPQTDAETRLGLSRKHWSHFDWRLQALGNFQTRHTPQSNC